MQGSMANEYKSILLAELAQAKELMIQLDAHFQTNSPTEFCKTLTPKILSSIEKSIYMARSYSPAGAGDFPQSISHNSNQVLKDQNQKEICKKRKTQPKWTSQIRLGAEAGVTEGPVGDVYSWRKYGQKDILGANYPRSYYRCTHRNTQGCSATKQVQRSDEDPQVFDITYHGTHTCLGRNQATAASTRREHQQKKSSQELHQQNDGLQNQDLLLNFQTNLQVKTEGLNYGMDQNNPVSYMSGLSPLVGITPENIFSSPSTPDNTLVRSSCPTFFSPTASELTYFSASPHRMNSLELEHKLQASESDIADMISTPMSSCSSTIMDMESMFNFDTDFNFDQFDASSFFS